MLAFKARIWARSSLVGESVYKCGCWWGEVVYTGGVVGDSGILSEMKVYRDMLGCEPAVVAPPTAAGSQPNMKLSRYVNR